LLKERDRMKVKIFDLENGAKKESGSGLKKLKFKKADSKEVDH